MLYEVSIPCLNPDRYTLESILMPLWFKVEQVLDNQGKVLNKMLGAFPFCENMQQLTLTTIHSNDN